MIRFFMLFGLLSMCWLMISCSRDYNPSAYLSPKEQDAMMDKVIRYLAKAPEGVSLQERFYKGYDDHYNAEKSRHRLDALFEADGFTYFLISRPAPSLTEKRVSTGGKFRLDADGNVVEYEEIFRTWKMPDTLLVKKSLLLFDKMVNGESLEPYLTKNSAPEEYIEFPDDHTYFDKVDRTWKPK